ncbi:uncharacterized protein LOC110031460 [Phalaenopsis equestris]|uniref:uncharacterized protein LOC110031460 n=1 Tax=Phalaenopsis equestris TaxID=78828 RepID=UPI0009E3A976|nr:uncharacterized protein LOC110031460 [Phalaenopsis equestris]
MGTRKISSFDAHLNLLDKKAVDGKIYRKIGFFISSCLIFLVNLVSVFFKFISGHVFRIKNSDGFVRDDSSVLESKELKQVEKFDQKGEVFMDEKVERRMPAFSFKYQTRSFAEKIAEMEEEEQGDETGREAISEKEDEPYLSAAEFNNYRFISEQNFSGLVEVPESMTFHVHESFIGFSEEIFDGGKKFLTVEDFLKPPKKSIFEEESNNGDSKFFDSVQKKGTEEGFIGLKYRIFEEDKSYSLASGTNSMEEREIRFISEDFSGFDFEFDTESSSDGYSVKEIIYDSDIDGFLSERDFEVEKNDSENRTNSPNSISMLQQVQSESFFLERTDDDDDDDDDDHGLDHDHEYLNDEEQDEEHKLLEELPPPLEEENELTEKPETELEAHGKETFLIETEKSTEAAPLITNSLQIEFIEDSSDEELSSVKNGGARVVNFGEFHFVKYVADSEPKTVPFDGEEVGNTEGDKSNYDLTNSVKVSDEKEQKIKESQLTEKKTVEPKSLNFDSEDLDEQWEHQELMEQLQMELKKVRAAGLPTIWEESESPMPMEDCRPFRIREKFLREDPMNELQKFYKGYRERMRKLDILNYQKMYAIGILKLKNPLLAIGTQRHSFSTIMSHLSQNLLPFCQKKFENDPSEKLFKDLQCDFETVYVGQLCLSWEFLRWQYEKSCGLSEFDPHRNLGYNEVADEFQQFYVSIQRFTENEPFQGPRLLNFINQSVIRNLLQVPLMKEDCLRNNMEKKEKDYAVSLEMLEDIMEEAIRVFWEFVKAEKDETPLLFRVLSDNNVEVQNPSDYELLEEIQSDLQKKEKKLKDLLRTGNCLVRKFKRPQEDRSNQDLFFSQVDLKVVSRVLRMPRITTEQLIWCHEKLSNITFCGKKVQRDPSFLVFPC